MSPKALLVASILALTVAGCGDDDKDTGAKPPGPQTMTSGDGGGVSQGARIFADEGCASCHTLAAADAGGVSGPNLDDRRPSFTTALVKVRAGGGGMPSYKGVIDDEEIEAVARFVADNAGR